jgi:pimeloyl-ACP methyl ester carboxylesterase
LKLAPAFGYFGYMDILEAGGLRLAVNDVGSGPAVLLLHPFPLDSTVFGPLVDSLSRERRVLTVDFPGFGASPPPAGEVTFTSYAKALREVLAKKQLSLIDALGVSMGGYALLELSLQAPRLLHRLVLAGSRATQSAPEALAKHEARATRAEHEGIGWLDAEWTPVLLKPNADLASKRIVGHMIRRATPQGVAAAARAIARRGDQTTAARGVVAKTLVIHGGEDRVITLAEAEVLAQLVPNARLEVIPSAGHVSNIDEPDHFTRALITFLES